jgi:signal transduction histidine kinase
MRATPRPPLLKRVPPGVWVAVTWLAVTIYPVIVYVALPPDNSVTFSYPRDGLESPRAQALMALATALALAGCALVRRRPRTAFILLIAATAATTLAWRQTEIPWPQFLPVAVALGFITALHPRRTSLIAAALAVGTIACYLSLRLLLWPTAGYPPEPFLALPLVIGWLIGNSVYQARAQAEQLRARATTQAVTDERLRIARELHDMVAHSTGIIALQAGAARRVIDTQPSRARDALGEIETASREVLAGLRRTLGALRQNDPGDEADWTPFAPALGLADIDRLAAATAAAGVRVDVRWLGQRRPLPPEISLSAYRIIQEAVTNVVRHADTRACQVTVDCREDQLSIEVADAGRGRGTTTGSGYGLLGMRERVSLLHGEFSAAPRPEGGFRVAARLPVPDAAR